MTIEAFEAAFLQWQETGEELGSIFKFSLHDGEENYLFCYDTGGSCGEYHVRLTKYQEGNFSVISDFGTQNYGCGRVIQYNDDFYYIFMPYNYSYKNYDGVTLHKLGPKAETESTTLRFLPMDFQWETIYFNEKECGEELARSLRFHHVESSFNYGSAFGKYIETGKGFGLEVYDEWEKEAEDFPSAYRTDFSNTEIPIFYTKTIFEPSNDYSTAHLQASFFMEDENGTPVELDNLKINEYLPDYDNELLQLWTEEYDEKTYLFQIYHLIDYYYLFTVSLLEGDAVTPIRQELILPVKEFVIDDFVPLSEFTNLKYDILVEAVMEYGASELLPLKFFAGKNYDSWQEGEKAYYELQKRVLADSFDAEIWNPSYWEEIADYDSQLSLDDGFERRAYAEQIMDISPDGRTVMTFESMAANQPWMGTVRFYDIETGEKQCEYEYVYENSVNTHSHQSFGMDIEREEEASKPYEIISLQDGNKKALYDTDEYSFGWYGIALNQDASCFAVRKEDKKGITIYDTQKEKETFCLAIEDFVSDDYILLQQFCGNEEEGFVLFSDFSKTYKWSFPDNQVEVLEENMYYANLSPDGQYLFYTGLSGDIYESAEFREDLVWEVPNVIYIKELETGKVYREELLEDWSCWEIYSRWVEAE